jgi:DnaJ-class molecular chaperone
VIDVPKKVSAEQQELLRKLAALEKLNIQPHQRSFFSKLKDLFSEE